MSLFRKKDLFGSGPHRIAVGVQGNSVVPNVLIGGPPPGSTPQGVRELDVIVRGRLVATSESALRNLREAITDLIDQPPITGELIDTVVRAWPDMSLISYTEDDRVDRGRVWSLAYTVVFRRFA